jgi:hypothetical protein
MLNKTIGQAIYTNAIRSAKVREEAYVGKARGSAANPITAK